MNNVTIQVDYADLPETLTLTEGMNCVDIIRAHQAGLDISTSGLVSAVCVDPEGPGGGWPVMELTFNSKVLAKLWLRDFDPYADFDTHMV